MFSMILDLVQLESLFVSTDIKTVCHTSTDVLKSIKKGEEEQS